ncbi:MHYT domain-containing protein [Euzebya tangerina]|uniref:MHYT domain-containing protein n=1 Tax=Euzebya tangerina TaxID=591198 RepID=UPI0013C37225|nr:MHYT domain-containing protein [Euzebya tangerina]
MSVTLSDFVMPFVILSFAFSVLGSALALTAVKVASKKDGRERMVWSAVAGVMLGGVGVWVMHFVGMLAYQPQMDVYYNTGMSVVSAIPAVIATSIGVWLVVQEFKLSRLVIAGGLIAAGVVGMHYTGMEAMVMSGGQMSYNYLLVGLSVILAIAAGTAALFIAVKIDGALRWAAAPVMGLAVCAMHYTGMFAMRMTMTGEVINVPENAFSETDVTLAVASGALVVLVMGAIAVGIDYLRVDAGLVPDADTAPAAA